MSPRPSRLLLLIESPDLGGLLQLTLRDYELEWHAQAGPARDAVRRRTFDLAVVDLAFDGRPAGLEAIREWRAGGAAFPIVATTDLSQPSLAIESLDAGADDFLRKPFYHEELRVRIRKLVARGAARAWVPPAESTRPGRESFRFGETTITPELTVGFPDGAEERIGSKQHGILRVFAARAGGLVLKDELVKAVWGASVNEAGHSANEYVSRLRGLFARHGIDLNQWVVSEPKVGWRVHPRAAGGRPVPAA